ncbi:MAG: error-prone DNA polymerase [Pseudomonadota bacterium]|nr:error-prone DNA polymerase [Pseudomonadota bacterium]
MSKLPGYAELHCRSNFSFLTGASHPSELIERAQALRYSALAITDECTLSGVVRAHVAAREAGLHLIIGAEMRLCLPGGQARPGQGPVDAPEPHARLVVLAQTRRGYGNLAHWITVARRRAPKGAYLAHPGDIEGKIPNAPTLAGLPDCLALLVPSAAQSFETVFAHAMWLKTWFQDRAAIAVAVLRRPGDEELLAVVRRVAQFTGLAIVATGDVLMHLRSRKPLQDVLTATRLKTQVAACGLQLASNAEQHLRSRMRLANLYEPEWLENTLLLAGRCRFSLAELKYEYPREVVPEGQTPTRHLRDLVYQGLDKRFGPERAADWVPQVEKELALIQQLEYEAYFLTVADIVRWARARNILCQGRGSAANSVVCYALEITEVNPAQARLLFERFISAERNEPPDIDVDFEHQRREEVIQYIYGKYGRHRTALTAVVICYRPRSALRDAGRALGLDLQRIELVTKSMHWFDGGHIDTARLGEAGLDPQAPLTRLWIDLTQQLIGFPRHLSQHPGGFVIAREQIEQLVPVEMAAMKDRSVVQWDKDDLDELRLIKVDVLALGMLSALRRSLEFIGTKLGRPWRMQDIPPGDAPTYEMICRADTVGVFQIESRAQMSMLPRLKPRCYYDLVVQVAIVRPGPIQGGMVHPYLKNRELSDDEIHYPPALRPALQRTKGVPIFQEQVMQIAMIAADFTPGEADGLRRAMAAWKRRGGLGHYRERLVGRMLEKGYDRAFAESIFKQIEGFGEYGFPESHAAGFAQLAYFSCWIKHHHPDAFLAALLNSQPMGFYAPAQLVRDARAHGVEVRAADVQLSLCASSLETGAPGGALQAVRLGLDRIGGLSAQAAERIVAARREASFANAEDLARRAALNARDLQCLAQADALHSLTGHRHQAAWAVAGIDTRPAPLLRDARVDEAEVCLPAPPEVEETLADYRALGLTLKRHPLALLREQLAAFKVQPAAVLRDYPDGRLARASGLVTHRQRPETAKGTMFVTLEDDTGTINAIVWPAVVETQRKPLLAARLLTLYGRWQRQGEGDTAVMHLVVMKAVDHSGLLQGLVNRSRDFH